MSPIKLEPILPCCLEWLLVFCSSRIDIRPSIYIYIYIYDIAIPNHRSMEFFIHICTSAISVKTSLGCHKSESLMGLTEFFGQDPGEQSQLVNDQSCPRGGEFENESSKHH